MATLTPKQIAQLMQILRDASTAVAVSTTGYEVSKEERERLEREGYLQPGEPIADFVYGSFVFGQVMQRDEGAQTMTYPQLLDHLKKNPVKLSAYERGAVDVARQRAGQYCVGLGNRFNAELGEVIINADAELAARTREKIREGVSTSIEKRETVKKLKSRLGNLTGDWARDWDRIAATESHAAHQEGVVSAIEEKYGDDELMAVIPEPSACKHCLKHYLEDGKPKVRPASWWRDQGNNVGSKAVDWKPVIPPMHPHCLCVTQRVPAGWGFDENNDLVPLEKSDVADDAKSLEKARKLHGRMKFQGFDINIENRKGSVRKWYDPHTDTEGQTKMTMPYGYLRMTVGADSEHVDCFVGPHEDAKNVYVVHQMKAPDFKVYDEDKILLGQKSALEAKRAYLQHFDQPGFFGSMTTLTVEQFRKKVFSKKKQMIKAAEQRKPNGQLEFGQWPAPNAEPIDELDIWKSAVESVGIRPEDFHLIVKYARQGHTGARQALDRVQDAVRKAGEGFPIQHGTNKPVGTMGRHGKPARTAGDNVRSDKTAAPQEDWPPTRKDKRTRKKRNLPRAQEEKDVRGLRAGSGWANPPKLDQVTTTVERVQPQDRTQARESLETQQRGRQELREGSKLSDLEIHR